MIYMVELNKTTYEKLKVKSDDTGISINDLAEKYINKCLNHELQMKLKEIDNMLDHDNPEGNNLREFVGLINSGEHISSAEEVRRSYRRLHG